MWPWGHVAVGYLLYSALTRFGTDRRVSGAGTLLAVFGTQAPDLVDKPLAWTMGVLPNGRSLAHSLVLGSLLVAVVCWYARHRDRPYHGLAFGLGYLSHPFADALYPFLDGDVASLAFLAYPVLPPVTYETDKSFIAHFMLLELSPEFWFELSLLVLATIVWWLDGKPGLSLARETIVTNYERYRNQAVGFLR
jgi:membrane-bound metal-dependent hydrolase YbcI (DUF457 family)